MKFPSVLWRRLLVIAVTAALATATLAALIRLNAQPEPSPERTATATGATTAAPTVTPPCAYLGEWEGRLAVFRTENAPPEEVYDVFIQTLPPTEQQALADRIPAYTEEELQGLLEDYTG